MKKIPFKFSLDIVKSDDSNEENWYVEGFCGTTDFDLQSDIITEDAFKTAENDLIENSTVLFNHDVNMPIGKVVEARAEEKGLWVKILLSKTVPDIWKKVQEGIISKFSIRGQVIDAVKKYVKELGKIANIINEMTLLECSLVSLPANAKARTTNWYIGKALKEFFKQGGEIPKMEFKDIGEVFEVFGGMIEKASDDNKALLPDVLSFLKKAEENKEDSAPINKDGEVWTQESVDGLVKDLEDAKKAAENINKDDVPKKVSGENWTQEDIDRMEKELKGLKDENTPEIPRKKSGDAYSQEEIDALVKELEELTVSNETTSQELSDIKADAEVEKQWDKIKGNYDEKIAKDIKVILKKSVVGENLSSDEILTLTAKKGVVTKPLINSSESLENLHKEITIDKKKDLIKIAGIKTRVVIKED